jgi:hypothetical protein
MVTLVWIGGQWSPAENRSSARLPILRKSQPTALPPRLVFSHYMAWSWRNTFTTLLIVALAVVAAVQVAATLDLAENERGEGPLLAATLRMWREPVSADWLKGPQYTLTCYGPLYLWTAMGLQALTGWKDSLLPGRLVSLAATFGTATLLWWAIRRQTRRSNPALFCALAYLLAWPVPYWGHLHRVDALAVLFSVAGIIAAGPPCRRPWLSALLIVAGSLVKQTAAFSAVPVVVYFLLRRRYRLAAGYSLAVALLGIGAWGALAVLMDRYFFIAAVGGNINDMALVRGIGNARDFFAASVALTTLAVLGHLLLRNRRQAARAARSLYVVAWIASILTCTLLAMKEGSGSYYFMEPTALAALVLCRFGPRELRRPAPSRWKTALAIVALAAAAPPTLAILCTEVGRACDRRAAEPLLPERGNRRDGVCVLADGEYVAKAIAAGCAVSVNDPFLFRLLVDGGSVDPAPLLRAMQKGDVQYLLLKVPPDFYRTIHKSDRHWPASVLDCMERYYRFDCKRNGVLIYKARPSGPSGEKNRSSAKPPILRQ